jgi:hypothetical protein
VLHDQGVTMNHSEFQNYTGSYWAYYKGKFAIAVRIRPNFARNPLRAAVEYDDEVKMRSSKMDIINDYSTLLIVTIYKLSRDWCTRGGDEVRFLIVYIFVLSIHSRSNLTVATILYRLLRSDATLFRTKASRLVH